MKNRIRLTESGLRRIIKESVKNILKEVALKGKSGKTYSLHGTDPESWAVMSRLRGKNGYCPNTPQYYHACRDEDNWIELDDKAHPNLRSRNNANRINAMMNRIDGKSKDIMAANESKTNRIVKESVNRILMEVRKPNDRIIGRHKFRGEYYDKNGNPIYTHPSKLDDPEGGTLSDDFLKNYGWRYSKSRGLHGQLSDPMNFPK